MAESRSRRSTENESKIEVVQIDGLVSNLLNIDKMSVIKSRGMNADFANKVLTF